ncbi:MAG: DNA-binding domain-containing protein [Paracoccaceae bacterium]|nr:DNA-binding domain-containing protein [Paracoccaceae bacterium]
MSVSQSQFRAALLDPAAAVPDGLHDPEARPAGRRFSVYRNNVAVSLTEALETAFPLIRKIVGEEFFHAMAGVFLRAHPPASPLLMFYGEEMPGFLASFPPVAHLGYLPDVARLELALRAAYHAADAAPVGPEALGAGADLMSARVTLAPALRVIRSRWPLHGIWRANTEDGAPKPGRAAEDVLVTRPALDPVVSLLPPGGADFIARLAQGETLAAAALAPGAGFDPGPTIGLMLEGNAITAIRFGDAK